MQGQIIKLSTSYLLEIEPHILARFRGFRQRDINPLESGGILMGKKLNNKFIIDFASTPGIEDIRRQNRFIRNKDRAQYIIDRELEKSGNRRIYLGEWHTHHEEKPYPSALDLKEWSLTFKSSKLNVDFMVCIIIGSENELFNLYISILSRKGHAEIEHKYGTNKKVQVLHYTSYTH